MGVDRDGAEPDAYDLGPVEQAAEERAREWMASADPSEGVGSKHHTVPRFYLRRFSNSDGRLWLRDRATGAGSLRSIEDLAIRNFFTLVNDHREFDGRLEQVLSVIEAGAACLFQSLMNPFVPPAPLNEEERYTLSQFLAFQMVRGTRRRREVELLADWHVKTMNGHRVTAEELRNVRAVPHPNEHLKLITRLPHELAPFIFERPVLRIVLDRPLLITCDEPVVANAGDDYVHHLPECSLTQDQIDRRLKKRKKNAKTPPHQVIHMYPTRPTGVALAEEIAFPLSPQMLLLLGPRGADVAYPMLRLAKEEADEVAEEINNLLILNSDDWLAARPDHPTFADRELPLPGPIMAVCDGGSVMSQQMRDAPSPRRPQRLRREWR